MNYLLSLFCSCPAEAGPGFDSAELPDVLLDGGAGWPGALQHHLARHRLVAALLLTEALVTRQHISAPQHIHTALASLETDPEKKFA